MSAAQKKARLLHDHASIGASQQHPSQATVPLNQPEDAGPSHADSVVDGDIYGNDCKFHSDSLDILRLS